MSESRDNTDNMHINIIDLKDENIVFEEIEVERSTYLTLQLWANDTRGIIKANYIWCSPNYEEREMSKLTTRIAVNGWLVDNEDYYLSEHFSI